MKLFIVTIMALAAVASAFPGKEIFNRQAECSACPPCPDGSWYVSLITTLLIPKPNFAYDYHQPRRSRLF